MIRIGCNKGRDSMPISRRTSRPEETSLQDVVPFRAWRYSPAAGDLARLVAPPYDVIGPAAAVPPLRTQTGTTW